MIELTPTFYLFAIPAVIFAGISKGGLGAGAAFAATPFLALILDPVQAVALMLPILMIIDATALRPWWGKWDREAAVVLILGGMIGTAVGAAIFSAVSTDAIRLMIGAVALGFVGFQLARSRGLLRAPATPSGRISGVFWGTVAGITSFISHAGGPPATVYLLGKRLSKEAFQGTIVIVFALINLTKFFVYIWMGLFGSTTVLAVGTLAPAAIAGTFIGVWAHNRLSEHLFYALIYVFLTITGLKLILDGLG